MHHNFKIISSSSSSSSSLYCFNLHNNNNETKKTLCKTTDTNLLFFIVREKVHTLFFTRIFNFFFPLFQVEYSLVFQWKPSSFYSFKAQLIKVQQYMTKKYKVYSGGWTPTIYEHIYFFNYIYLAESNQTLTKITFQNSAETFNELIKFWCILFGVCYNGVHNIHIPWTFYQI